MKPSLYGDIWAFNIAQDRIRSGMVKQTKRGRRLSIPVLVGLVGERNAVRLCRSWSKHQIPSLEPYLRARRDQAALRDYTLGWSLRDISLKYRVDFRYLKRLVSRNRRRAPSEPTRYPTIRQLLERP
jgi:hypothetical protein